MKTINLLPLIFLAAIIGGCTDTDSLSPVAPATVDYSNTVSVEEALQNADEHFAKVFGENTRSGRTPASIDLIHRATRSSEGGIEGFYLVNYADDKGFALLSADRRLTPVYAVANEGQLYLTDTLDNKGLSWYLNTAVPLMANGEICERDTTLHSFKFPEKICETIKTPLLNTVLSHLHQRMPYNQYCPVVDGNLTFVGCGPLAAGTIMGYYEYPKIIDERTMYWNEMKQNSTDSNWAWLFATLGDSKHMWAKYEGVEGTSVSVRGFSHGLEVEGYNISTEKSFREDLGVKELVNERLIILMGYLTSAPGRHIWVVDGGYRWIHRYPDEAIFPGTGPIEKITYYFHCIWGEGGYGNGYYLYNTTLGGKAISHKSDEFGDIGETFRYLSMFTDVQPAIN
ncbi:MAG: C10 family peptidase [Muribaculaceae bacterium]|nr:C10 family peptidase [Muribaculaceae bacterium]